LFKERPTCLKEHDLKALARNLMSLTATPDVPQNFPEKPASSSRVIKPVVTVAHFVQNLGCVWIATKACPTYFLVMAKILVLV
jgi:hypothetical protein